MDKFQYHIRMQEWKTLTTLKAKDKFIRDLYEELDYYIWYGMNGLPAIRTTRKTVTLLIRAITTAFHTYDIKRLPDYIPATVWALRR